MSVPTPSELTHLNADGHPHMVDVGGKPDTQREARVEARVRLGARAFDLARSGGHRKGDVLAVARLAGIQGAKRAADLVPLCHPLPIDAVSVDIFAEPNPAGGGTLRVVCTVRTRWRTGVEMEAMTAASAAALTIYDMLKGTERGIVIEALRLLEKKVAEAGTGGRPIVDHAPFSPLSSPHDLRAGRRPRF